MGVAPQLLDLTITSDRLIFHGADGPVEFPLPYEIHAKLIQTSELARLLAEHVRDGDLPGLPPAGSKVRLHIPASWGPVCLRLPAFDPAALGQPAHHLLWEVESNAPESAGQYYFSVSVGDAETRLLALRVGLCRFLESFCEELEWSLDSLFVLGEDYDGFGLDLNEARDWQERLKEESFPKQFNLKPLLVSVVALVLLSVWLWQYVGKDDLANNQEPALADSSQQQELPLIEPVRATGDSAPDSMVQESPVQLEEEPPPALVSQGPESSEPASRPSVTAQSTGSRALLLAWQDLLGALASHESTLPDFLVLDSGGLLARREGPAGLSLVEAVGRPARVTQVGPQSVRVQFNQSLFPSRPGVVQFGREDGSRPAQSLQLKSLDELAGQLEAAPYRLVLQRRHVADAAGAGLQWRFRETTGAAEALGWRVRIFPLAGPLGRREVVQP